MSEKFPLFPFPGTGEEEKTKFEITASQSIETRKGQEECVLSYRIRARDPEALREIVFPSADKGAERRDGLWESTCFEAFFSVFGSEAYFEWNASPSGAWNLYRFENYRSGMKAVEISPASVPEVSADPTPAEDRLAELSSSQLRIECRIPVSGFQSEAINSFGFAVVLATKRGLTYWATAHEGEKPDFHQKKFRQIKYKTV